MTDFNFDNAEFNPNAFDEEQLDIQKGSELNPDFMNIEDENELSMNVSIQGKSDEEIAHEVESTLIDFLSSKDQDIILSITGETHESSNLIDPQIANAFSSMYTRATTYNPAIRWYAKLAKMLPAEKFSVSDKGLSLKMGETLFKKALFPFLGDFKADLRDSSPIVDLIYSMASCVKDKEVQHQLDKALSQEGSKVDPGQFDPGASEMEESMLDVSGVELGEVHVDDDNEMGLTEIIKTETPSISLLDLANKTIAEHFMSNDIETGEVVEKLAGEGFPRSRINEIVGIIKFIKLNKAMGDGRVTPAGNRGAGDIDFDFM